MNLNGSKGEQAEGGFAPLPDADAFDGLLARSHDAPVLLFLHDPYCPISRRAWGEMQQLAEQPLADAYLVNVSRQHDLSDAIAARTGVRHESPQALVLRDGKAVWDASHFSITAQAVGSALAGSAQK
ncbi:MAG: bacillithiol system redox-active protein YtxJ [Thermomicrobiales bacterium]